MNLGQFKIVMFPNNFMSEVFLSLKNEFISMVIYVFHSEISTGILVHAPAFPISVVFCG